VVAAAPLPLFFTYPETTKVDVPSLKNSLEFITIFADPIVMPLKHPERIRQTKTAKTITFFIPPSVCLRHSTEKQILSPGQDFWSKSSNNSNF
jgi:hypothetical protein